MMLREFSMRDYEQVIDLWEALDGVGLSEDDSPEGIARLLASDPAFLVLEDGGRIVGTVIGTWNGRRGWIYHLAVAAEYQRRGYGRLLLHEAENRLWAKGARKLALHVMPENENAQAFYRAMGYAEYDQQRAPKYFSKMRGAERTTPAGAAPGPREKRH